jgi:hypothetical protein
MGAFPGARMAGLEWRECSGRARPGGALSGPA